MHAGIFEHSNPAVFYRNKPTANHRRVKHDSQPKHEPGRITPSLTTHMPQYSSEWKKRSGFTLLELLIVIAIIGLLASIMMMSVARARAKARDAKRLGDMEQLQRLLELYADDHQRFAPNEYPPSGSDLCSVSEPGNPNLCYWASTGGWIPALIGQGYTTVLPQDPRGFPEYQPYKYLHSEKYGYILSFKLEALAQQDECHLQPSPPTYSTRCGRIP